jgi:hypothetical protein
MSRGDLERVWNGDVLIVAPVRASDRSSARKLASTLTGAASETGGSPRDALEKKPSANRSFFWLLCLLCLCAVVGSGSLVLYPAINAWVAISEVPRGESSASPAVNRSPAGSSLVGAQDRNESTTKPGAIASTGALHSSPIVSSIQESPPETLPGTAVPAAPPPLPAGPVLSETGSNRAGELPPVERAEAALIQPAVPNAGAAAPPKPAVTQSENRSSPTLSNPRPAPAERAPAASDGNLVSRELVSRETTALPAGAEAGPTHATPIETPSRQTRHASAAEISAQLSRGDSLFGSADIASARLFYERAAEAGDAQAALRLGQTYDASFLVWAHLGSRGNLELAQHWYQRARELGASEAEVLLKNVKRTSKP